jgi:SpoVK/Ycf46/Vps4 family AAA+-type ATPase
MRKSCGGVVATWILLAPCSSSFISPRASQRRYPAVKQSLYSSTTSTIEQRGSQAFNKIHDASHIPSQFHPLFSAAANATLLKGANSEDGAHDSFRYEWGTWCVDENVEYLMDRVNEVRLNQGVYDKIIEPPLEKDDNSDLKQELVKFRVASGTDWDCILYFLPRDAEWRGRRPSGSWAIVKTLIGVAEIAALSGPDRDGRYKKKTTKDLRGGGDGSLAGGKSTAGLDCIKYVGGPLRAYMGKAGKTVLLEVVVTPPITALDAHAYREDLEQFEDIESILSIVEAIPEPDKAEKDEPLPTVSVTETAKHLGNSMGMSFDKVGGLDAQLDAIARRVLASRANPEAARRLGVSHVRGILLSGPPGCGKTLLARELAHILGAREPQIVNGPEILDKFIGEAEKNIRALFAPAEQEYREVGDASALHIIILDEMDAIARKRGSMSSDSTGVRDSVVNQLLAKMDGVKEANNVLVVGLTNRPELLDPALLRPGRLEVQLRVELPDLVGRRDILRIHTRRMREAGGMSPSVVDLIEDLSEFGIPARSEHFTGAELAGLVRSAASFALARTIGDDKEEGIVAVPDIEKALGEVLPALGKQDEVLKMRHPFGISPYSASIKRILRDLRRFTAPAVSKAPRLQSLLLVGAGANGGAGVTALASWAASEASSSGSSDYVRFVSALDLLRGSGEDATRAAALADRFSEARELSHSLLVLDDVDQLCAGSGPAGYSSVMLATLRALLRSPPAGKSSAPRGGGKTVHILATTSRSDAACVTLHELFDETIVVPLLSLPEEVRTVLEDGLGEAVINPGVMADMIIGSLGQVGCKTALRLAERAVTVAAFGDGSELGKAQLQALEEILDDLSGDQATAQTLCEVIF